MRLSCLVTLMTLVTAALSGCGEDATTGPASGTHGRGNDSCVPKHLGTISYPEMVPSSLTVLESKGRLFVADLSTPHVLVYDVGTLALLGEISLPGEAISVAVHEATARVYISFADLLAGMFSEPQLAVVDGTTLSITKTFPDVGGQVEVLQSSGRLYVHGGFPVSKFTILDPPGFAAVPVTLPDHLLSAGFAVNQATGDAFVGYPDGQMLTIIDGRSFLPMTVMGVNSFQVVVNDRENKVYGIKTDWTSYWVFNRASGALKEVVDGNDAGFLVYNRATNRLFTDSEVNAQSTVIDGVTDDYTSVPLPQGLAAVGTGKKMRQVFVVGEEEIAVVDADTLTVHHMPNPALTPPVVGEHPMAVDDTSGRVFIANESRAEDSTNTSSIVVFGGCAP